MSTTQASREYLSASDPAETASLLVSGALRSAASWHRGQRRRFDAAPYIEHPVEVARLLHEFGTSPTVVAAGLLHDVLEKTDATADELEARFGSSVAQLVVAVSDRDRHAPFRERKRELRSRVERFGADAVLILAADTVSKVRELTRLATREPDRFGPGRDDILARLEHYQCSVRMLSRVARGHPLVGLLRGELAAYSLTGAAVREQRP